jgi:hypothetical protein
LRPSPVQQFSHNSFLHVRFFAYDGWGVALERPSAGSDP